jgi:aminodeoxyfutalosine deaminase
MGEMRAHVSRWVLPVSGSLIEEGAVLTADGRIQAVGPAAAVLRGFSGPVDDHGSGAILPGLVNCHVHLEFSALAGMISPQERWQDWLELTLAAFPGVSPREREAGIRRGIEDLRGCGTALAGDISNTGESLPYLEAAALEYQLFFECLGFDLLDLNSLEEAFPFFAASAAGANPWVSAAAHAPYSVSPALFRAVKEWNGGRNRPQSVHLGESAAESDFLARGDGFFQGLLKRRGRWIPGYQPPKMTPAAYLASLDFLDKNTLAVHGCWLNPADCALLVRTNTWLILCPRANAYTGAGAPPVAELIKAGARLALGTDSLAGNYDLNLFGEMLWLYQKYPQYSPDLWLRLGTLQGAAALKRDRDLGSLAPGKTAALGFLPLSGGKNFWEELYASGAAGKWQWLS